MKAKTTQEIVRYMVAVGFDSRYSPKDEAEKSDTPIYVTEVNAPEDSEPSYSFGKTRNPEKSYAPPGEKKKKQEPAEKDSKELASETYKKQYAEASKEAKKDDDNLTQDPNTSPDLLFKISSSYSPMQALPESAIGVPRKVIGPQAFYAVPREEEGKNHQDTMPGSIDNKVGKLDIAKGNRDKPKGIVGVINMNAYKPMMHYQPLQKAA